MQNPGATQPGLRCQVCALAEDRLVVGTRALYTMVVAHADPEVVVLVDPGALDILVVPRRHLGALSTTPDLAAPVLSALRVVTDILRSTAGAAGATVEPTLGVGGTVHVCFRVVPTAPTNGDTPHVDTESVIQSMIEVITDALGPARDPARHTAPPGWRLIRSTTAPDTTVRAAAEERKGQRG
jgi:hypothetical protein